MDSQDRCVSKLWGVAWCCIMSPKTFVFANTFRFPQLKIQHLFVNIPEVKSPHYVTNPNKALLKEIPQIYHTFALFDSPKMGGM